MNLIGETCAKVVCKTGIHRAEYEPVIPLDRVCVCVCVCVKYVMIIVCFPLLVMT
jgi:hypothetical protein